VTIFGNDGSVALDTGWRKQIHHGHFDRVTQETRWRRHCWFDTLALSLALLRSDSGRSTAPSRGDGCTAHDDMSLSDCVVVVGNEQCVQL
jgi:hypothetical protein